MNRLLQDDLAFTFGALKEHPKVYWIWTHRQWCLEHIPEDDSSDEGSDPLQWQRQTWTHELIVVEKMLDVDARNCMPLSLPPLYIFLISHCAGTLTTAIVHAWAYRRYILKSMPPPGPSIPARSPTTELVYTQKKIESNFSNFSAWHQRTKVYAVTEQLRDPTLLDSGILPSRSECLPRGLNCVSVEFDFVVQAMYTDPNDQSAWLYHRWLISLSMFFLPLPSAWFLT